VLNSFYFEFAHVNFVEIPITTTFRHVTRGMTGLPSDESPAAADDTYDFGRVIR
jgi:hypothetical protein